MSEAKGGPAKAFADGLMITRAEARADLDAAVALALEAAAKVALTVSGDFYGVERATAIRALIQPHQADALARVRQEAVQAEWDAIEAAWKDDHAMQAGLIAIRNRRALIQRDEVAA